MTIDPAKHHTSRSNPASDLLALIHPVKRVLTKIQKCLANAVQGFSRNSLSTMQYHTSPSN